MEALGNQADDDVIFFADDGGSWEFGIDWRQVLPPYFKVLSVAVTPVKYASQVRLLIERRYPCNRDQMLAIARRTAARQGSGLGFCLPSGDRDRGAR